MHYSHLLSFLLILSFSLTGLSQTFEVEGTPGNSGIIVRNAGVDGLVIEDANDDGLDITATDIGALIFGDYQAATFGSSGNSPEGAIYVANGNFNLPDIDLNGGIIRSFRGFNFQLDRFNSGTNYDFIVSQDGTDLLSIDETGLTEFSNIMSLSPTDRNLEFGSPGHVAVAFEETGNGAARNGRILIRHATEGDAILLQAAGSGDAPFMEMRRPDGTIGIKLDVEDGGDSRITTDELEIMGGSDLAEHFDVEDDVLLEPGTVVSIDPDHPGKLILATNPYDQKVAGIISGAKGIESGLVMGQKGSIADGAHPVALVGRVYALADASKHAIKPGDLLTTSSTPGHVMKVTKHRKAKGAIVGKAMTSLDSGLGYVLVLINLQ